MTFSFNPSQGLIIVRVEIWGPANSMVLRMALDTGATFTVVSQSRLIQMGYDPTAAIQ